MMKKSLLAAALLGIVAASGAQAAAAQAPASDSVMVNFSGVAKAPTCTVTVGTANTLDLGVLPLTNQAQTTPVPVRFSVSGCQGKTVGKIEFNGGVDGEQGKFGELNTNQANVKVQLSKSDKFDDLGKLTPVNVTTTLNSGNVSFQPFFARLKVTQGTASAGNLNATGRFTVSYQ